MEANLEENLVRELSGKGVFLFSADHGRNANTILSIHFLL